MPGTLPVIVIADDVGIPNVTEREVVLICAYISDVISRILAEDP